jgi:lysozyme family protein
MKSEGGKQIRNGKLISNFGIEQPVLTEYNKANKLNLQLKNLNKSNAKQVHEWNLKRSKTPRLNNKYDEIIEDSVTHWGDSGTIKIIQEIIGATSDGKWGAESDKKYKEFIDKYGEYDYIKKFLSAQREYMRKRTNYGKNKHGWENRLKNL